MKWSNSIPNSLSGLRILIAIAFPFLPKELRVFFLSLALLTEYLDGALARKFDWTSSLGKTLDPIADRLFAFSVGLTFVSNSQISLGAFFFLFFRDLTVAIGFLFFVILKRNFKVIPLFQPNLWGKLTTVLQYLVFFNVLLAGEANGWVIFITGIVGAVSAIFYAKIFLSTYKINGLLQLDGPGFNSEKQK